MAESNANRARCGFEGCFRSYSCLFNLKRHEEICHGSGGKYKCSHCGKFLSSGQNLKDHLNVHSGERPYRCDRAGCGLRFKQMSQFYSHKKMHLEADGCEEKRVTDYEVKIGFLTRKLAFEIEKEDSQEMKVENNSRCLFAFPLIDAERQKLEYPKFYELLEKSRGN